MWGFIARRLVQGVLIVLGVTGIIFLLLNAVGGDPAVVMAGKNATAEQLATIRAQYGLDQPLHKQYIDYLGQIITLEFGQSYQTKESVRELIASRVGPSLSLTLPA